MLSRIDGHTPWRLLREIGGLSPDEVDMCIEMWLADEIIEMGSRERKPIVKRPAEPVAVPGQFDEGGIDETLDLASRWVSAFTSPLTIVHI